MPQHTHTQTHTHTHMMARVWKRFTKVLRIGESRFFVVLGNDRPRLPPWRSLFKPLLRSTTEAKKLKKVYFNELYGNIRLVAGTVFNPTNTLFLTEKRKKKMFHLIVVPEFPNTFLPVSLCLHIVHFLFITFWFWFFYILFLLRSQFSLRISARCTTTSEI